MFTQGKMFKPRCGVLLGLMLAGCASKSLSCADEPPSPQLDDRARWLRDRLLEDNRDLLEREPELTQGKLIKMASSPYNYFRGTAAIYLRDVDQAGPYAQPSSFISQGALKIALAGDPHPENYGTFRAPNDDLIIDLNDLDAATYGPYLLDVRRLALGFYMLGQAALEAELIAQPQRDQLVDAVSAGYVEQLLALERGERGVTQRFPEAQPGPPPTHKIFADLLRRARRDGRAREELDEYTQLNAQGRRVMRYGVIEAAPDPRLYGDELIPTSPQEAQLIKDALARYPETLDALKPKPSPAQLAIKGSGRRLGAGVSSYPVRRYYVLIEGPSAAQDDDLLLELKETLDVPLYQGIKLSPVRTHKTNAERVVAMQRQLQLSSVQDPWLGFSAIPPLSLRVRERTKYQKGVDLARILEELGEAKLSADDVRHLAYDAGAILAAAHARAKTLDGEQGLTVLGALFDEPSKDKFIQENAAFISTYGPVTRQDHARLEALIEAYGPTLGYRFHSAPQRVTP